MKQAPSPQQIAEASAARMYELDDAARALGVVLDEIGPGRSRMSMTVREDMVNSHRICHGGMIFSLADCAFAYSCNSYNRTTVAAGAMIDYVSPAQLDHPPDRLLRSLARLKPAHRHAADRTLVPPRRLRGLAIARQRQLHGVVDDIGLQVAEVRSVLLRDGAGVRDACCGEPPDHPPRETHAVIEAEPVVVVSELTDVPDVGLAHYFRRHGTHSDGNGVRVNYVAT